MTRYSAIVVGVAIFLCFAEMVWLFFDAKRLPSMLSLQAVALLLVSVLAVEGHENG